MISLESKTQTATPSSPLKLSPKEEGGESTLSFSELLRGVSLKKDDIVIQNGTLVLALDEEKSLDTKAVALLELLKGKKKDSKVTLDLNPEITKDLSSREVKVLIKDAKEYLKNKIIRSEGFKKIEIATLPKTLKGLVSVAKKFDIDISKITLQEVKSTSVPLKIVQVPLKSIAPQVEEQISDTKDSVEKRVDEKLMKESKVDLKLEIKATPLFKAQVQKEITTEQLVNTKLSTLEVSTPKKKADEILKLLLSGERVSKGEKGLTADFTVSTARVIAPQAPTNINNSLESLLRGDNSENAQASKLEGLNLVKSDSFEIKLNEAKQMTKYLSQDVKTAIEDYKSPFTRIKVALNPQRLGSVELTVVQRGNNLHISLSSNNAAINALAMNVNDLKLQLTNNGINNASLNFNNNSDSSQQGSFGQEHRNPQERKDAKEEYNYFSNEEKNEEILNSLEIVVPHYA